MRPPLWWLRLNYRLQYHYRRGRIRFASEVVSVVTLVVSFAAASGSQLAERVTLGVLAFGALLALIQFGRGFFRAISGLARIFARGLRRGVVRVAVRRLTGPSRLAAAGAQYGERQKPGDLPAGVGLELVPARWVFLSVARGAHYYQGQFFLAGS